MSQQELLSFVIETLDRLGIEFMLTGSHASSFQGIARATHDIDLVAKLAPADAPPLISAFPEDRFYLNPAAIDDAIRARQMFNVLDLDTGEKIDFWLLTDSRFDRSRFKRRQRIELDGQSVHVSSPEDTILMKLHWCQQAGGSEKQLSDALRVYELQASFLNMSYLESWAQELGVESLWQQLLEEAKPWNPGESLDQ